MRRREHAKAVAARIRARLTYANVMASIAVFLVLGGGVATALSQNSVGTRELKKDAVKGRHVDEHKLKGRHVKFGKLKGRHVKDGTIRTRDIADGAVTDAKLAEVTENANYAAAAFVPVEESTHNNMGESVCGNFVPTDQGAENQGDLDARLGSFLTGVELPSGATLQRLTLFANDFSAEDAHLYLVRKRIADGLAPQFEGYEVIAQTSTSGAENNVMRSFGVPIDAAQTDNESFFYYLELVVCDAIEPFTAQVTYRHTR